MPRCGLENPSEVGQGYGEKGVRGSRSKPNLSMPTRPTRKRAKNQSRGLLKEGEGKEKEEKGLEEDLLGERRRDWREEEEREVMIWEGTEM